MTKFIAKRVAPGVDIWDLLADGKDIGCLTRFPGEGPMATVKGDGLETTIWNSATIHECLVRAKAAYLDLIDPAVQAEMEAACDAAELRNDEDYVEDEDGDIAFQRMMERRYERFDHDEPHWC